MGENHKERNKLNLTYINFFSQPQIKDRNTKLLIYSPFFDFLFLLKDRFEVHVIDHIGISESFREDGIQFHYYRRNSNRISFPLKAIAQIRKLQPDVVYVQGLSYPHFVIIMKRVLKPSARILVHDHANAVPTGWKTLLYKKADPYIDNYFFTSKLLARPWIHKGIIASEQKVIECIEGSTNFSFNESVIKDENSFLWVGRLDKNKDPLTVLKAFSEFINLKPDAALNLIFENRSLLDEVRDFIKDNQLDKNVKLIGYLPHRDMEYWYQKSNYFILGSYKEGGPISLIEAMACGCIPIVTSIPAFQTIIDNGECGFLFDPGDHLQLLQVLKGLDDLDLESIRRKVVERFKRELSHSAIATKIEYAATGFKQ